MQCSVPPLIMFLQTGQKRALRDFSGAILINWRCFKPFKRRDMLMANHCRFQPSLLPKRDSFLPSSTRVTMILFLFSPSFFFFFNLMLNDDSAGAKRKRGKKERMKKLLFKDETWFSCWWRRFFNVKDTFSWTPGWIVDVFRLKSWNRHKWWYLARNEVELN